MIILKASCNYDDDYQGTVFQTVILVVHNPGTVSRVTTASLSTALQAGRRLSPGWSRRGTTLQAAAWAQQSACGFWKTTETTGTTSLKWQPAFRLVKVVFVVVNRQHRVQNQTVVPVVSVVVKTGKYLTRLSKNRTFLSFFTYTLHKIFGKLAFTTNIL